uniref:Uncharacterized protein n=1 Tax=Romanomermis culicivorax TaxID=13658 RepID=A0A915KTQ5_ROMCU
MCKVSQKSWSVGALFRGVMGVGEGFSNEVCEVAPLIDIIPTLIGRRISIVNIVAAVEEKVEACLKIGNCS